MAFRLTKGREAAQRLGDQRAALKAQVIRTEAVLNAPVQTGRLRQSIGIQKVGDGHYRVGTSVSYAPFVEYGTRHQRAQPFMRPAVEKVRQQR